MHLKNAYCFVEKNNEVNLEHMETMASFDVTSLLTNNPTEDVIQIEKTFTRKWNLEKMLQNYLYQTYLICSN